MRIVLIFLLLCSPALAHDPGHPELDEWFNRLAAPLPASARLMLAGFFFRLNSYMLWPLDRVGVGADAKKGNHWPRRMGYHRSIGNCADRARAASTATPTAHSYGRYQEAFGRRL